MNRYETEERWKELFLGKHINGEEIINIEAEGPPSFVYGSIEYRTQSGRSFAPRYINQFRPAIKNMKEIVDEYKEVKDE